MTTIVYDHKNKEIAYDSRICTGDIITSDTYDKSIAQDGVTYIFSGSICDYQDFIDSFVKNKKADFVYSCDAMMIKDGKAYQLYIDNDDNYRMNELTYNACAGSGGYFALSALDFCKSAKEAVEYAMTRDSCTGGEIKVIKL